MFFAESPAVGGWVGNGSLPSPALEIVVEGFSVAFQTSMSIGEKLLVNLSLRPSGDSPSRQS